MNRRYILLLTLLFLWASLGFGALQAQSEPLTAEVNQTDVTTDDTINLTITIHDAGSASQPRLPDLSDFQVLGSSRASQMSIVNGNVSSQIIHRYTLRPITTGDLTIAAIEATIDGQVYQTDPIHLQVAQGSLPISSVLDPSLALLTPDDFYMEAEVDNPTPYQGQQVIYTFRAYLKEGLQVNAPYDIPDFSGFWKQDTIDPSAYSVEQENGRFNVLEFQTPLFPMVAGEQTIPPTTLSVQNADTQNNLHTNPVLVNVQPLPQPAPDTFTGAVGRFSLSASVDTTETAVDDPITLRLILSGEGNIEALPDPEWPTIANWRTFDNDSSIQTGQQNGRFSGSRIYERVLIPSVSGSFTIPPITYTYFDPQTASYQTTSTDPIPLSVTDAAYPAPPLPDADAAPEPVAPLTTDIRHIKPAPAALAKTTTPLPTNPGYWLLWLIPPTLLVLDAIWRRRQNHLTPQTGRRSQASTQAYHLLKQGRQGAVDPYTAINQALNSYLSHKLGQPTGGLTQTALTTLLAQRGVAESLINQVNQALEWSEFGRFSPASTNGDHAPDLFKRTWQLITELETVL